MNMMELLKDLIKEAKEWNYLRVNDNPATFLELLDIIYDNGYCTGCDDTTHDYQETYGVW